jgi:hypothetical protein
MYADSVFYVISPTQGSTAVIVAASSNKKIILVGLGGCGALGGNRISILDKI